MTSNSEQRNDRGGVILPSLTLAIDVLTAASNASGSIPPAQVAFAAAAVLLTMINDTISNRQDYVDLGIFCTDVCQTLYGGLKGRQLGSLNQSVLGAIGRLTTTIAEVQANVVKQGERNPISRFITSKYDKQQIAAWERVLTRILQVFNMELLINNNSMLSDIYNTVVEGQEANNAQASAPPGELPPPPPRVCFGRDELIEEVAALVDKLEPVALIGAGGIGKTSIALTVLHHQRIKDRFGDNRRFIRCDRFTASRANLLNMLSKAIGAGVENPVDLTPLRPFLSSGEMVIFLDNAESILDPQGTDAGEISAVVEELTRFKNICLGITSRISAVPPHCKRPTISALSPESACDVFYSIYNGHGHSNTVCDLLKQLDFHALSITLLATAASRNMWDYDRLSKEWETRRSQVLQTGHNESLAAAIELSLASPTFSKLNPPSKSLQLTSSQKFRKFIPSSFLVPTAREMLEVVAFFPQGVDEKNLEWLFPTTPDRENIFDKFCLLSLTYRSNGFITMLSPIRDYLRPQDPESSPFLCATKNRYFTRLSVLVDPDQPGFNEARWIISGDVNVEHLLDVFTSVNGDSADVWDACSHFVEHLLWHKPRQTVLRQKIEGLPDDHRSKSECLFQLARLFGSIGNPTEKKRLLTHTLGLQGGWWNLPRAYHTLRFLANANRELGLYEEGIQQAQKVLKICKRFGHTTGEAYCWNDLADLFLSNNQLDDAQDAASRVINIAQKKGLKGILCNSHQTLGNIHRSKGEKEESINHFEAALQVATSSGLHNELVWTHLSLAKLFSGEDELDEAITHIKQAKLHATRDPYNLACATERLAAIYHRKNDLEDAKSEILHAQEIYLRLGLSDDVERCSGLLSVIEEAMESGASDESSSASVMQSDRSTISPNH